jgi:hypothetical protein
MAAKKKAKGGGAKAKSAKPEAAATAQKAAPAAVVAHEAQVVTRDAPMLGAEYYEDLPVTAELHERDHAGHELAKLVAANETLKTEKRQALAEFKERKASIETTQKELASVYDGLKLSKVKVQELIYADTCTVDVIRKDTGEVVRSRAATKDDLQRTLDDAVKTAKNNEVDLDKDAKSVSARLDAAIARGVAALPPLPGAPEALAPEAGTLKGPGEVEAPADGKGEAAPDPDSDEPGDEDGAAPGTREPDEDDPLGLGDGT